MVLIFADLVKMGFTTFKGNHLEEGLIGGLTSPHAISGEIILVAVRSIRSYVSVPLFDRKLYQAGTPYNKIDLAYQLGCVSSCFSELCKQNFYSLWFSAKWLSLR